MAAALGGLDALVFTGGVGERRARDPRARGGRLGFLGVELDREANAGAVPDADVSGEGAAVRVYVIKAREELVIARAVRTLLA